MDSVSIGYPLVILLGLALGSFAGATVWRLRARQLVQDKAEGELVDKKELKRLKPLTKATLKTDRSRCLECGHELAWHDLLPLASWMSTRGKCRYCKRPIGRFEPAMELGTAGVFVALYAFWAISGAFAWPLLLLWFVVMTMLVILFAYDAKWFLLPDAVMFPLIAVSGLIAAIRVIGSSDITGALLNTLGAVLILGGLYLALWYGSKGRWVGFGDVKLGLALGLLLGDWQLAFLALFLANLIGTLIVIPGLLSKRLTRTSHVPFGPLLIAGFLLSFLLGGPVISLYTGLTIGLVGTLLML